MAAGGAPLVAEGGYAPVQPACDMTRLLPDTPGQPDSRHKSSGRCRPSGAGTRVEGIRLADRTRPEGDVTVFRRFALGLLICGGCSRLGSDIETSQTSRSVTERANVVEWMGATSHGQSVLVRSSAAPSVGLNRLVIEVGTDGSPPRSVDVVAPAMPMHGVVRRIVERDGEHWSVQIEFPMPGEWVLYVNFDEGSNAAAFPLAVADEESASLVGHHH